MKEGICLKYKWPIADAGFLKINSGNTIEIMNNNKLDVEFYNYAAMFRISAHLLTEYLIKEKSIIKLDTYFFAVAYLYRHSIELILKAIGFKYIVSIEDGKAFLKDTFHNLSEIFKVITPHIKNILDKDLDAYIWLKYFLKDIDIVDKESDSFRYPFGISVEKVNSGFEVKKVFSVKLVFDKNIHINLITFVNKMEVTFELFDEIYKEKYDKSTIYKSHRPVFIEEGGSYYGQSVVGYNYDSKKFYPYVKAYTETPEILCNMINKDSKLKGCLFIPMCYLYRNAVELSLKELLFEECSFGLNEALDLMSKKKHKILGLWNLIKEEIKEHANAPEDDKTIIDVENYIVQLNNFDGSSDKFRYPTDKHLNMHFETKKKFDIDNVNNYFGQLLSFLSAVNTEMSVYNEYKAEMKSYYDQGDYY